MLMQRYITCIFGLLAERVMIYELLNIFPCDLAPRFNLSEKCEHLIEPNKKN